jgi:uroporphyrin-III C-methyltransferase / precorrin-2 dehydrogenase / sirohydrochlorin ferrochelatase
VVPGVSSAIGVPTAAGLPVTHRGTAQDFHVVSVHVPPGDERSTLDWSALARSEGTLVLLMSLDRIGAVTRALIEHGRAENCPVSVIADGTMPTQRTIFSTLEDVERRLAAEGIRPPAVVVIGGVVAIAAELAGLGREPGNRDENGHDAVPSPVPPLAEDSQLNEHKTRRDHGR